MFVPSLLQPTARLLWFLSTMLRVLCMSPACWSLIVRYAISTCESTFRRSRSYNSFLFFTK